MMLLLALVVIPMSAQRPTKYRVQRGETLASIARKFGMTESELKRINDDLSYCYAGMLILVRDKRGDSRSDDYADDYGDDGYADDRIEMNEAPSAPYGDPLLDEARQLEQMGKFKQAVKCYDKVLDRGPSAPIFFSRGVCYFQMKKWKKAIEDFERVTRSSDATRDLRDRSEDYIDEAYMRWDKAKERSTNTWAGIIGGVVAVGAVADALSGPSPKGGKGGHNDKNGKGKNGPPPGKNGQGSKNGQAQGKQGGPPSGNNARAGQGGNRGDRQQGTRPSGNGGDRKPNANQGGNRGNRDGQQGTRPSGNGGDRKPNANQGGNRGNRDGQQGARQGGNGGDRKPNANQGGNHGNRDGQKGNRPNGNRRDRNE